MKNELSTHLKTKIVLFYIGYIDILDRNNYDDDRYCLDIELNRRISIKVYDYNVFEMGFDFLVYERGSDKKNGFSISSDDMFNIRRIEKLNRIKLNIKNKQD